MSRRPLLLLLLLSACAAAAGSPSLAPPLAPSPSAPSGGVTAAPGAALSREQLERVDALSRRVAALHERLGQHVRGSQDQADRLAALLHRLAANDHAVAHKGRELHERAAISRGHSAAVREGLEDVSRRQRGIFEVQEQLGRLQGMLTDVVTSSPPEAVAVAGAAPAPAPAAADELSAPPADEPRPLAGTLQAGAVLTLPPGKFMYNHTYDVHPAPRMTLHLREDGTLAGRAAFVALPSPEERMFTGTWTAHGMRFEITRARGPAQRWRVHTAGGTDSLRGTWVSDEHAASFLYRAVTVQGASAHVEDGEALAAREDAAEKEAEAAHAAAEAEAADAAEQAAPHHHDETPQEVAAHAPHAPLHPGYYHAHGYTASAEGGKVLPSADMFLHLDEHGVVTGAATYNEEDHAKSSTSVVHGAWHDEALTFSEEVDGHTAHFDGHTLGEPGHVSGEFFVEGGSFTKGLFELHLSGAQQEEFEHHVALAGAHHAGAEEGEAAAAAAAAADGGHHVTTGGVSYHLPAAPADWNAPTPKVEAIAVEGGRVEADVKGADEAAAQEAEDAAHPAEAGSPRRGVMAEEHDLGPVTGDLVAGFYLLSAGERVDSETDERVEAKDAVMTLHSDGTMTGEDGERRASGDWSERLMQWVENVNGAEYIFTGVLHPERSEVSGSFSYAGGAGSGQFKYRAQHVLLRHPEAGDLMDRLHGTDAESRAGAKPKTVTELLSSAKMAAGDVSHFVTKAERPSTDEIVERVTGGDSWKPARVAKRVQ